SAMPLRRLLRGGLRRTTLREPHESKRDGEGRTRDRRLSKSKIVRVAACTAGMRPSWPAQAFPWGADYCGVNQSAAAALAEAAPTIFAERFGSIVMTAEVCGTPVIPADWRRPGN